MTNHQSVASAADDPDLLPPALAALERAVLAEEDAWQRALLASGCPSNPASFGVPDPAEDGGLPAGWCVVAELNDYLTPPDKEPDTRILLVRRDGGGWLLLRREDDIERTQRMWLDATLGLLYQHVCEQAAIGTIDPLRLEPIAAWLKGVLLSMYDADDPIEAGEQVLFAMTGVLTVPPRAAN